VNTSTSSPAGLPALQALALRCERGERPLFDRLALSVAAGEVIWLRGRNGRGKTTLLRTLAGLSQAAAGELRWGGQPVREVTPGWRAALVHIGHANALKEDLSAAESLAFLARLAGARPDAAALERALARLGMQGMAARAVRTFSQGQRRRVALARLALAPRPSLWLLDEPFDALDDDGIARLASLVTEHAAAGGSVIYTSHQAVGALAGVAREVTLDDFQPGARHAQRAS
jgi:heme exporter protein A